MEALKEHLKFEFEDLLGEVVGKGLAEFSKRKWVQQAQDCVASCPRVIGYSENARHVTCGRPNHNPHPNLTLIQGNDPKGKATEANLVGGYYFFSLGMSNTLVT